MDKFYEIDQKWLDDNSDIVSDAIERNWNIAIGNVVESDYASYNHIPYISFEHNGMDISNPFMDESGRFSLSLKESVERYGADNVHTFLQRLKEEEINPRVITIFSDDPELLKELKQTYGKNVVIDDNFEHLSAMQDEIFLTKSSYAILAYKGEEQKEHLSEYAQNVNDTYDISADSNRLKLNKIMEYIEAYNSLISDIRYGNAAVKFESWFFSGGRGEDTAFYDIIDAKTNEKAGFIGFVSYDEIEVEYKGYRFTNYTRIHSTFEGQEKQLWETVNNALNRDDPLFYNIKVGSFEDFTRDEFIQAVKNNNEYIIGEGFPRDEFLKKLSLYDEISALKSEIETGKATLRFSRMGYLSNEDDYVKYSITDAETKEEIGHICYYPYFVDISYKDCNFECGYDGSEKRYYLTGILETINKACDRDDPLFANVPFACEADTDREDFIQAVKDNNIHIIGKDFPREEFLEKLKKIEKEEKTNVSKSKADFEKE